MCLHDPKTILPGGQTFSNLSDIRMIVVFLVPPLLVLESLKYSPGGAGSQVGPDVEGPRHMKEYFKMAAQAVSLLPTRVPVPFNFSCACPPFGVSEQLFVLFDTIGAPFLDIA